MANVKQQVDVCQELKVALNLLVSLVSDVMAGKGAPAVVADALPQVISALSGLAELKNEMVPANGKAVDNTVLLFLGELKQVLIPGVV